MSLPKIRNNKWLCEKCHFYSSMDSPRCAFCGAKKDVKRDENGNIVKIKN